MKFSATINTGTQTENLVLTTGAPGCSGNNKEGDTQLSISIPIGPGGKHFSPGPFAVSASVTNEKDKFAASFVDGVVNIEPGEWKVGNKIKGTLRIDDAEMKDDKKLSYTGSGSFEAEICALADPADLGFQATPADFEKTPATGSFGGGDKFTFKSGIAVLSHNRARDIDEITEIHLFDSDVTCDNQVFGPQFVKFDAIELKEGSVIKGSVYLETATSAAKDPKRAGKVSGSFTATVCKS